jgi:cytidylate kinase
VVVGRDITSEVLPNAEIKIFLTANLEIRSRRRYEQYPEKMILDEVKEELKKRDERDTKRNISPLKKTADS